jgi:GT2 family glycosyltransferase
MSTSAHRLPSLSVVIPTYNRPRLLARAVDALSTQHGLGPGRLEVIVVDDGSAERADHVVSSITTPFQLRVLREAHSGVAAARNAGWRSATGEIVVFLDDDVIPGPRWASAHAAAHVTAKDVVVLGPVSANPARGRDAWNAYEDAIRTRKYRALSRSEIPSGIPYGGNFSVRREHLEKAGGFDQMLVGNHDVDLGFRFQRMGLRFHYEPAAAAIHTGGSDLSSWTQMHRRLGRMDVAMYRDRGYAGGLPSLIACFHDRHLLNRMLVRLALTSRGNERRAVDLAMALGVSAHRLGLSRVSRASVSASANALYWSGVRDGMRGNRQFWELVRRTRHYAGRPFELDLLRDRT